MEIVPIEGAAAGGVEALGVADGAETGAAVRAAARFELEARFQGLHGRYAFLRFCQAR